MSRTSVRKSCSSVDKQVLPETFLQMFLQNRKSISLMFYSTAIILVVSTNLETPCKISESFLVWTLMNIQKDFTPLQLLNAEHESFIYMLCSMEQHPTFAHWQGRLHNSLKAQISIIHSKRSSGKRAWSTSSCSPRCWRISG